MSTDAAEPVCSGATFWADSACHVSRARRCVQSARLRRPSAGDHPMSQAARHRPPRPAEGNQRATAGTSCGGSDLTSTPRPARRDAARSDGPRDPPSVRAIRPPTASAGGISHARGRVDRPSRRGLEPAPQRRFRRSTSPPPRQRARPQAARQARRRRGRSTSRGAPPRLVVLGACRLAQLIGRRTALELLREHPPDRGYRIIGRRAEHQLLAAVFDQNRANPPALSYSRRYGHLPTLRYHKTSHHGHGRLPWPWSAQDIIAIKQRPPPRARPSRSQAPRPRPRQSRCRPL
jgi:hypothetical protein